MQNRSTSEVNRRFQSQMGRIEYAAFPSTATGLLWHARIFFLMQLQTSIEDPGKPGGRHYSCPNPKGLAFPFQYCA